MTAQFVQFLTVEMYIIRNAFIKPTQYKNVIFRINQHIFSNSVRDNWPYIPEENNEGRISDKQTPISPPKNYILSK